MSAEHQWRWQPLLEQWVLIAAASQSRPWSGASASGQVEQVPEHDPDCYLCPSVTRASGNVNPQYTTPWAFDNDFASLVPGDDTPATNSSNSDGPLHKNAPAKGRCRVLCWHPSHNKTLADCSESELLDVAKLWQSEYASLSVDKSIAQIMMFENKGREVGVSNLHPHGQIYASHKVSDYGNRIRHSQHEYTKTNKQPLLQSLIARDEYQQELLVEQGSYFKTIVPYAARLPFETWIVPTRHVQSVDLLSDTELTELALMYQRQVQRYDRLFNRSSPLLTLFQNAPCDDHIANVDWCFHIAMQPPLRDSTTLKYFAGYEASSNNVVNPVQPEMAAKALRQCFANEARS